MLITISIFLYLYFGFLAIWSVFSLVAIYHMLKFGFKSFATFATTILFICVSLFVLAGTYNYLSDIDWNKEIIIFQNPLNTELQIN